MTAASTPVPATPEESQAYASGVTINDASERTQHCGALFICGSAKRAVSIGTNAHRNTLRHNFWEGGIYVEETTNVVEGNVVLSEIDSADGMLPFRPDRVIRLRLGLIRAMMNTWMHHEPAERLHGGIVGRVCRY